MAALSKRMANLREKVADKGPVSVKEAVELLKGFGELKFDQSVEIAMRLGIEKPENRLHEWSITTISDSETRMLGF